MDPDDWHTAYVIDVDGKLWRTTDTGATFQNVTGTLSDVGALRSLEYFAGGNGDYLLVGADAGVFIASFSNFSAGAFNSWKEMGDNLPNAPVYDMIYDAIDDVLVAGTLGRGAWTIPKFSKILEPTKNNSSISSILLLLLGDD
jgi:ligand-binding sensor domain-containing protein